MQHMQLGLIFLIKGDSLYTAHRKNSIMGPCILTDTAAPVGALDHENAIQWP